MKLIFHFGRIILLEPTVEFLSVAVLSTRYSFAERFKRKHHVLLCANEEDLRLPTKKTIILPFFVSINMHILVHWLDFFQSNCSINYRVIHLNYYGTRQWPMFVHWETFFVRGRFHAALKQIKTTSTVSA